MKSSISAASAVAVLLLAAHLPAQTTGTSHPEDLNDAITTPSAPAKPSPAVPMPAAAPVLQQHDADSPDAATSPASPQPEPPQPTSPAAIETAQTAQDGATFTVTDDINSGVVIDVPAAENQLPEGTILKAVLDHDISTQTSHLGEAFHAQLTSNIERRGKVMLPIGSVLSGRVSDLHGGHRIGGAAAIHLVPEFVTLPDGTTYKLDAQVIDLGHRRSSYVNDEGTIIGNDHSKGTLAALGLTTASAAAAGSVVGGGVGALVGAGIGVGAATVFWLKHENQETLPQGATIIFSLNQPMTIGPLSH